MFADLVDEHRVRLAQDHQFLAGDLAGAADGKAGAGEGVAADEAGRQAKLAAKRPHLVLEQLAQRFHQGHAHLLGQAADIVVRLDRHGRPAGKADRFDDIGIERALGQEPRPAHRSGMFLEDFDEQSPDGLALDLGVADPFQRAQEQVGFIGMDQRHVVMVAEHGHDLPGLVLAQQPMVDEDAGQLIANRLVDQHGGHRTVDPPGKAADHLFATNLRADLCNRVFAVSPHRPVAGEAGQADEVFIQLCPLGCVVHFGVELHRKKAACGIGGDGEGRVGRGAKDLKTGGDFRHMVAMAHPDLFASVGEPAVQQSHTIRRRCDIGAAEFRRAMPAFHLAAQAMHHHLLAVTDAQDRHAQPECGFRGHRRAFGKDRGRPPREDDRLWRELCQEGVSDLLKRMNFTIDVQLAQAARNQLRHLAAEVDDKQTVMLDHSCAIWGRAALRKGARRGQGGCTQGFCNPRPRRIRLNVKWAGLLLI